MRIKPEQLQSNLNKHPPAVFVVSGDEPLLRQEACDEIRAYSRKQGFSERIVFHTPKNFDWSALDEHTQSFSLFGEKKLLEIHLDSLPNDGGKKRLAAFSENPPEDCLMLIISDRIESSTLNTKWFKSIETHSLHVQVWPISHDQLPNWINQRLHKLGFTPTSGAVKALCDHVEGNLLAARQEMEKLRLLSDDANLDEEQVLRGISNSNKFTVFNLVDACLERNPKQALKVLQTLQAESFEPTIVLWSLAREVRLIAKLYKHSQTSQGLEQALQKERVFKNRWALYKRFIPRFNAARLRDIHQACQTADRSIKGLDSTPVWSTLTYAALELAGAGLSTS
ncbi:DNA polymerase III subunit delta [Hahella sp. HN01]|uniref:DNA polymerase III subunit delta n=1 Tax=Hahella sp. HN01 TaxID=2847262 RepID=UPI001C1F1373|nr:DNA polymerase III subunit delta [Hahella sp. HN01]MBU6950027.1 DNA polymerase III subunit delta [Hahella sp. HN01]